MAAPPPPPPLLSALPPALPSFLKTRFCALINCFPAGREMLRGQRTPRVFIFDEPLLRPRTRPNTGWLPITTKARNPRPARAGEERSTKASVVPDSSRFCRGFDVHFARTFLLTIHCLGSTPRLLFCYPWKEKNARNVKRCIQRSGDSNNFAM